jgi:hypothetical protein
LAHLGTSWHIVAHRGTSCQEALRTNHGHAVPFVILCASLVAFEIWWESIPESKRKYEVHKKIPQARFVCPASPAKLPNHASPMGKRQTLLPGKEYTEWPGNQPDTFWFHTTPLDRYQLYQNEEAPELPNSN